MVLVLEPASGGRDIESDDYPPLPPPRIILVVGGGRSFRGGREGGSRAARARAFSPTSCVRGNGNPEASLTRSRAPGSALRAGSRAGGRCGHREPAPRATQPNGNGAGGGGGEPRVPDARQVGLANSSPPELKQLQNMLEITLQG